MQERAPGTLNLTPLEDQLLRESTAMASYALASGKHLPPRVADILQSSQMATQVATEAASVASIDPLVLAWAHAQLTRLVAPAAPRAVLLLAEQFGNRGRWSIFGPIPLVRYLLAIAFLSMLGLLFAGATEQVSLTTANIFNLVGLASILNSFFLLCAASLGASFSGLFRINLYIAATTYDPKYDASYWVQYGLGVIAGVLLGTLIPLAGHAQWPAQSRGRVRQRWRMKVGGRGRTRSRVHRLSGTCPLCPNGVSGASASRVPFRSYARFQDFCPAWRIRPLPRSALDRTTFALLPPG